MIGLVLGTGPSLADAAEHIRQFPGLVFGINNTFEDFELDCWIACDPKWHDEFSPVVGDFDKWHWNREICLRYGYRYIAGRWFDGLSTDKTWIAYNHSSGAQALNLAVHYDCNPILLIGFDMHYSGKRHYFSGLSDVPGEYPEGLRKHSTFDGLLECYGHIARQPGLPRIINCTPGSAMKCFPFGNLADYCGA